MNAPYSPASLVIIAVAAVLLLALLRARSPLLTVALIGPLFFFIVAAILHASQLFVMGAMVLGVALLSYLLSTLSLHHVAVSREVPTPLTAGEAAPFTLTAENKSRLPKVFLRISAGIPPGIDAVPKHHLLAVLWPGQRASLEGVMTAPARGAYPLAPVEVVATDPLGLFRRRRALPGTGEVLVYPRICRIEYHEYLGESAYGSTSPRHSVLPGHGLDFHSLRDYHPGDDLRRPEMHPHPVPVLQRDTRVADHPHGDIEHRGRVQRARLGQHIAPLHLLGGAHVVHRWGVESGHRCGPLLVVVMSSLRARPRARVPCPSPVGRS